MAFNYEGRSANRMADYLAKQGVRRKVPFVANTLSVLSLFIWYNAFIPALLAFSLSFAISCYLQ